MSYTTTYGVNNHGNLIVLEEHRNSFLSAPLLWEYLLKKYNLVPESEYFIGFSNEPTCLWTQHAFRLWKTEGFYEQISKEEWFVLFSTYDRVAFHQECLPQLIQSFKKVHNSILENDKNKSNFLSIAETLENSQEFQCFSWGQTSVSDPWEEVEYDEELDKQSIFNIDCSIIYGYKKFIDYHGSIDFNFGVKS